MYDHTLFSGARHSLTVGLLTLIITLPFFANAQVLEDTENTDSSPEVRQETNTWFAVEGISSSRMGDFVVGPGKVELTINPGESKTVLLSLANRIGERKTFALEVEDAVGSRDVEESVLLLGDDYGPYTMKDYVSIPGYTLELDHNMRARIPVTISIPPNAEPGGRYGSVLINTVATEGVAGTSDLAPTSPVVARIGTLFFITIPGDTDRDGEVIDFSTIPKKKWFQEGPLTFGITFENNGDIHLAPYGEIRITNMFDEEVGFVELEPWFVYPDAIRLREVTWNREALLGKYTATLKINRSYDDVIDTREVTFYVIPVKIIIGTFVVVFFVLFLFRFIAKNFEFRRKV